MSININLPDINGDFEIGFSVGLDPALADLEKLPIAETGTLGEAAKIAAQWAYLTFSRKGDAALEIYVSGAVGVILAKLFAKVGAHPDGDWRSITGVNDVPGLTDLTDADKAKINTFLTTEKIRTALVLVLASKANFWNTNHHTGQSERGEYLFNYIRKVAMAKVSPTVYTDEPVCTAIHTIGHWASTIRCLGIGGIAGLRAVTPDLRPSSFEVKLSDDAKLRYTGPPAGTHRLAVAYEAARRLVVQDISGFCPGLEEFMALPVVYKEIMRDRVSYHVGAHYLTGRPRENYDDTICESFLGRLGTFVTVIMKAGSLAKSPHLDPGRVKSYDDYSESWRKVLETYMASASRSSSAATDFVAKVWDTINIDGMRRAKKAFKVGDSGAASDGSASESDGGTQSPGPGPSTSATASTKKLTKRRATRSATE